MNQTKFFNSGLGMNTARPSGSVVSSNPHRWRGKRLHNHGGGVCWLLVLLWMDSWHHELIRWKKWYKNNLKMRLTVLLFDALRRAPHLPSTSFLGPVQPQELMMETTDSPDNKLLELMESQEDVWVCPRDLLCISWGSLEDQIDCSCTSLDILDGFLSNIVMLT